MRGFYLVSLAALCTIATPAAARVDPDPVVADEFPVVLIGEADTRLAEAFGAAFKLSAEKAAEYETTRRIDGRTYYFSPVAMHVVDEANKVYALFSVGVLDAAGHGESGINAMHYLRSSPTGWQVQGEWLNLGATGTMGNAATSWGFTQLLGRNLYLATSGGGTWQGCTVSSTTLIEMTPERPVDRGSFADAMGSGAGEGQAEQSYEGKIVAAEPDKSFTLAFTGTKAVTQQYALVDGSYRRVAGEAIPGC